MTAAQVKKSQVKRRGGGNTLPTGRKRSGDVEPAPTAPPLRKKKKTAAQLEDDGLECNCAVIAF